MARALYDNVPESPEELAFRKGDILTVIEQDTGGLEGWWLCAVHGRQGIAPGNRLQLFEVPPSQPPHHSPGSGKQDGLYQVPMGKQLYQVPQPNKVVTPVRTGHSYTYEQPPLVRQDLYDMPSSARPLGVASVLPGQLYDTPPAAHEIYSVPPCRAVPATHEGSYDFPQPLRPKAGGVYDVPPSVVTHVSPSAAPKTGVSGNGGSVYDIPPAQRSGGHWEVYDIPRGAPPAHTKSVQSLRDVTHGMCHLYLSSFATSSRRGSCGEVEPTQERSADVALRRVAELQQTVDGAVRVLLGLAASPSWRTVSFMEQHGSELRAATDSLRVALADLLLVGQGAVGGAGVLSELGLHDKLRRQLHRLDDSLQIVQQSSRALDSASRAPAALLPPDQPVGRNDDLERLLVVCRSVPDDVKLLASVLAAHRGGQLDPEPLPELEPPTLPFPVPWDQREHKVPDESRERGVRSWMEDYDYVHLQGKDEFERQQQELLDKENIIKQSKVDLEEAQLRQYKRLEQEVIRPVENVDPQRDSHPAGSAGGVAALSERDQQLLRFYSEQCDTHFATFLNAVDAFFSCVGAGQPPRIFVAHSKLVILSAHKLVFIGDTLSRQVAAPDVAHRVTDGSNTLCQLLKTVVEATRMAALRYPSTVALQEMVDRVTLLSHHAAQLKAQLRHTPAP